MQTDKALRRAAKVYKARYGPQGGLGSDRRPIAVRTDAGAAKRLVRALDRRSEEPLPHMTSEYAWRIIREKEDRE